MTFPVAIFVSDIHLTDKPPPARAAEENWHAAMKRQLDQINELKQKHNIPVIVTGDVFDKAGSLPSIVNFSLRHLPDCYAIAGNHDLPGHLLSEIKKSAFWTLVEAGKITVLEPRKPVVVDGAVPIRLHGFPYGSKVRPLIDPHDLAIEVAVIHAYIWTKKTGYPGALKEQYWKWYHKNLKGFDVAVFGDNHRSFLIPKEHSGTSPTIMNVGGFLRRRMDERVYRPCVGLLQDDGSVVKFFLDTSQDKWSDVDEVSKIQGMDVSFIEELEGLEADSLDYREHINHLLESNKASDGVRKWVLMATES